MKDSPDQTLTLPPTVPVMVLPGAVLFPQAMLPLMIFEPRYRAMLAEALDQERMFCIAMLKPELTDWSSPDDFHHIAGLGLIRACVGHDDGTSHLMLQGLARVEFTGFPRMHPCVVAEIREVAPEPASGSATISVMREISADFTSKEQGVPTEFQRQLAEVTDAGVLCDLLANALVQQPEHRQKLLETFDVSKRFDALIHYLHTERAE